MVEENSESEFVRHLDCKKITIDPGYLASEFIFKLQAVSRHNILLYKCTKNYTAIDHCK